MGFLLATPTDFSSYALLSLILLCLALPWMLKWHRAVLICCWNASLIVYFLPGQPSIGELMSFVSLSIAIVTRTLTKESRFIKVPGVTKPVVFICVVVLVTAICTGGIGAQALGSEVWGGKRYMSLFAAVAGFFALISEPIPPSQAKWLTALFFISGTTAIMSDLVFAAGPAFYILYAFFPSDVAYLQATTEGTIMRLAGPGWAAQAVFYYMLMRYGIRGVLDLSRPWRLAAFLLCGGLTLLGGFRSSLIFLAILFAALFWFEGLFHSRMVIVGVLIATLGGAFLVAFVDRLPLSVQRSVSFLPLDIDPMAKQDAASSLEWRFLMWKIVVPDVPKYLLLGKGFSFSGTDYRLTDESIRRNLYKAYEATLISGNYHNGILTLIIPFGIWGVIGFGWFCWKALGVLRHNYRYGDASLRMVNNFLFADFVARLIFYLVFYGQFDQDLFNFAGVLGLSIALNAGTLKKVEPVPEVQPTTAPVLAPQFATVIRPAR